MTIKKILKTNWKKEMSLLIPMISTNQIMKQLIFLKGKKMIVIFTCSVLYILGSVNMSVLNYICNKFDDACKFILRLAANLFITFLLDVRKGIEFI